MAAKTPLSFGTPDGDSCGPVTSIDEVKTGDTITPETVPWEGIIGGTDITAVYSTTSVTLNSTAAGGGGTVTEVQGGTGITVVNGTTIPVVTATVVDGVTSVLAGTGISIAGGTGASPTVTATTLGTVTSVTAGDGLFGTGTATVNPTLAVIAGDGIDIISDAVTVDVSDIIDTAAGLTENSNNIQCKVDGITMDIDSGGSLRCFQTCAPWSWVHITADDGIAMSDHYYFGYTSTVSVTELLPSEITWESLPGGSPTMSGFTIANAGYYEFEMQASFLVGGTSTTITLEILASTGYGLVETSYIEKVQTIRTNMDPHLASIRWIGYVAAGVSITARIDGSNTVAMKKGSTFTCKRIN